MSRMLREIIGAGMILVPVGVVMALAFRSMFEGSWFKAIAALFVVSAWFTAAALLIASGKGKEDE